MPRNSDLLLSETSRTFEDCLVTYCRTRPVAYGYLSLTAVPVTNTTTMPPRADGMLIS